MSEKFDPLPYLQINAEMVYVTCNIQKESFDIGLLVFKYYVIFISHISVFTEV